MIKILEDLLIEATTNANVPGSLVAGLRKAVDAARCGSVKGKTFGFLGVLPALPRGVSRDRIEAAGGKILSDASADLGFLVVEYEPGSKIWEALESGTIDRLKTMIAADLLPPPFDSQEEAQRAAGCVPTAAASYRVCIRDSEMGKAGEVMFLGNVPDSTYPPHADWLPCDKEGWVSCRLSGPEGLATEWRGHPGLSDWRPVRTPQFSFSTGHVDAIPKPSAIDEIAEQMRRWAAPTRDDTPEDLEIQRKVHEDMWAHLPESVMSEEEIAAYRGSKLKRAAEVLGMPYSPPALAVQEGGSHYKSMKIQPVEYIHANGLGYFEGNVVKYVSRWRAKGGLQDLKKARHYLDLLIELEGGIK